MPIGDLTAASIEMELRAACLELEQRLRAGEECSAEQLLALYPKLGDDSDSALELIFAELVLRRQRGEPISPEQWYERFPQWRERLERLLHVYEIMGAEASLATAGVGDTVRSSDSLHIRLAPSSEVRRVGNYEVLEEIARGGMGVVYKARHVGLNRVVALKLILAGEHAGPEHRARFQREAESAARLQHPSIVQIFEIGQEGNRPFLILEYVAGPSLDQFLIGRRAEGSMGLPARQAAELVECLARAIHHAHQNGVVHRDLKPANVLLTGAECGEQRAESQNANNEFSPALNSPLSALRPKITDFGLAKTLNESQQETRTGVLLGTPSYMAPEQAAGRSADIGPATDIFALGVILYELLTGYLPFQGTSVEETLEQVRVVEPIPPGQLQRNIPRDLQTICLKCLQKESTKRYVSAEALAEDIQRFLRDEPIRARPVGRTERTWRWCRRNPAVAFLTGGIALVLVCGMIISTALSVWALREKSRAAVNARQALHNAEQERQARALADQRFAQAEKAVEEYLDGIEKNERLKEADFTNLRTQLLTSAVPFYEDFVQQKPDDTALDAKRGRAYYRLASLRDQLGDREQALADYRQMQDIFRKLVTVAPQVVEYRQELTKCHGDLGLLLRNLGRYAEAEIELRRVLDEAPPESATAVHQHESEVARSHTNLGTVFLDQGKWTEAATEFRRALDMLKSLAAKFPDVPQYRRHQATTHDNLGTVLNRLGQRDEAEASHRLGLSLRQTLVQEFPDNSQNRRYVAVNHLNLGIHLYEREKLPEAEGELLQAIKLYQSLVADFPGVPDYRNEFAGARLNLGALLTKLQKPEDAKAQYEQAWKLCTELVAQFPDVPAYQSGLGKCLNNLAELLRNEGNLDEARRLFLQAVEHQLMACRMVPNNPNYANALRNHYHGLADTHIGKKDHAAAAEAARRLAQVRPDVGDDAQLAARFFVHCARFAEQDSALSEATRQSLARSYADEAMEQVRDAIRRGFTDVKALKDLEVLRRRPDFQMLVAGLYRVDGALEGEQLKVLQVTAGKTFVQLMTEFTADRWSGNQQLYWKGGKPGARLDLAIPINAAGTYDVELVLTKAPDYGVAQLSLDEAKLGDPIDLFYVRGVVTTGVIKNNGIPLEAGEHTLSIEIRGANPLALNEYMIGLDYVRVVPSTQTGK